MRSGIFFCSLLNPQLLVQCVVPVGSQCLFENGFIPVGNAGEETSTVNLRLKCETSKAFFLSPRLKMLLMFTALSPGCLFGISGKVLS